MINLNEKCLLDFLRRSSSEGTEKENNLIRLLNDFGVKIKKNKCNSEVIEIIEDCEKIY